MRLHRIILLTGLMALPMLGTPALANETVTFSYDALGRLTGVAHGGTINNGTNATYQYDPAGNRTNVTVTGASPPPARFIVVPLNGLTLIPIGP